MSITIKFRPGIEEQVRRVAEREGTSEHAVVESIVAQVRAALGRGKKPRLRVVSAETLKWKSANDFIIAGE